MRPTQNETPPLHTAIQDRLLGIFTPLDYQQSDMAEQITGAVVVFRPCTSAMQSKSQQETGLVNLYSII